MAILKENILAVINEWDPIGLFPFAPIDEYAEEVEKIYEKILSCPIKEPRVLAAFLTSVFFESFGNDVFVKNDDEILEIAKKILDCTGDS